MVSSLLTEPLLVADTINRIGGANEYGPRQRKTARKAILQKLFEIYTFNSFK
jgi:hypothetical protein